MLEYDKTDVPEGNKVNKTNESRKCIICSHYYFLKVKFRFQPKVCNDCDDLMQKAMSLIMLILLLSKKIIIEISFDIWVRIKS